MTTEVIIPSARKGIKLLDTVKAAGYDTLNEFQEFLDAARPKAKGGLMRKAKGGLAEATARLRAQEFSAGGTVIKTKTVAIDKSPNSGLITQRGFGASRKT